MTDAQICRSLQRCCVHWECSRLIFYQVGGVRKEIHVTTLPTAFASHVFTCCRIPIFLSILIKMAASSLLQHGWLAEYMFVLAVRKPVFFKCTTGLVFEGEYLFFVSFSRTFPELWPHLPNLRTFPGPRMILLNSRTFPVFPNPWEPWNKSMYTRKAWYSWYKMYATMHDIDDLKLTR